MSSVTTRVREVKQPYGGFIKPSSLHIDVYHDNFQLNEHESVASTIVGMAVDYLSRLSIGIPIREVFSLSIEGAIRAGKTKEALGYLSEIKGTDESSVINTCKLSAFDCWIRNPISALHATPPSELVIDKQTVSNIQIMVQRCHNFFTQNGPIIKSGFTFEPTGYTKIIDSGDGDYLTQNGLWDIKVLSSKLTSKHTLQILVYWIMGLHSQKPEFRSISMLGIFNPRLNTSYTIQTSDIPDEIIDTVEHEVIGY